MPSLALEAFGGLSSRLLWLALLHSLWIGLFLAASVAWVFQLVPWLSHRAQHRILTAALALVAVGPGVFAAVQHRMACRPSAMESTASGLEIAVMSKGPVGGVPARRESTYGRQLEARLVASDGHRSPALVITDVIGVVQRFRTLGLAIWSSVVAILGSILCMGACKIRRLRSEGVPAPDGIQRRARGLARRLRLRTIPRVQVHPRIGEPCLCGVFRPVIFLPGDWLGSAREKHVDAILSHELAHARRLDTFVNLLQRLVEMLLFFHPAVHWLSRSLRRQREFCADALAVRLTRNPLALAEALESVARLRLRAAGTTATVGTSLGGDPSSLLPRIQELIGMMPSHHRRPLWPFAALPAAAFISLVAMSAGSAQERAASNSPPIAASPRRPTASKPTASNIGLVDGPITADGLTPRPDRRTGGGAHDRESQLVLEVRSVVAESEGWRDRFENRLKPIDRAAWLMDAETFNDALKFMQTDARSAILDHKNVTTFLNTTATIGDSRTVHYVSRVEKVGQPGAQAFRPIVAEVEDGWKLSMNGFFLADGTRLAVDLHDRSLRGFDDLHREARFDGRVIRATYQVPDVIERRRQLSIEIPKGSSLVISVGLIFDRDAGKRLVSHIKEIVGLEGINDKVSPRDRLIVITPRELTPEQLERAGNR